MFVLSLHYISPDLWHRLHFLSAFISLFLPSRRRRRRFPLPPPPPPSSCHSSLHLISTQLPPPSLHPGCLLEQALSLRNRNTSRHLGAYSHLPPCLLSLLLFKDNEKTHSHFLPPKSLISVLWNVVVLLPRVNRMFRIPQWVAAVEESH